MKSIQPIAALLAAAVLLSSSAYADRGGNDRGGYGRGGHDRGGYYPSRYVQTSHYNNYNNHRANWIVPLMIGGALGYVLSEPRRETVTYVQSVQSPVVYQSSSYSSEPVYREQWVYFNDCDCERRVLVPIR